MSQKEEFLAKFGSVGHLDHILDKPSSSSVNYLTMKNPHIQSHHIDKLIDKGVDHEDLLWNANVTSDHISKILDKTKNQGFYDVNHRRIVAGALSQPNATPEHFNDVLNNSHEKVLHHVFSYVHRKEFPQEFFDKAAQHPRKMVRTALVLHKDTPNSALHILANDKEESVATYAKARLDGRI